MFFPPEGERGGAKKSKRVFITCHWKLIISSWITTRQKKLAKPLETIHKAHWPVRTMMLKNTAMFNLFDYTLFYSHLTISAGSNSEPGFIFFPNEFFFSAPLHKTKNIYYKRYVPRLQKTSLAWKQNELNLDFCQELLDSIGKSLGEADNKMTIWF